MGQFLDRFGRLDCLNVRWMRSLDQRLWLEYTDRISNFEFSTICLLGDYPVLRQLLVGQKFRSNNSRSVRGVLDYHTNIRWFSWLSVTGILFTFLPLLGREFFTDYPRDSASQQAGLQVIACGLQVFFAIGMVLTRHNGAGDTKNAAVGLISVCFGYGNSTGLFFWLFTFELNI